MKSISNFFKRTTKSEWGFYIYGMGSLQFAVLVFGVVTVVLEATAAESSTQSDGITACDTSIKNYKCWIDIFGWAISPTTYSLYVLTIGHLLQAFSLIQFSGLSDHGNLRSIYLIFFTVLGGIGSATIVFAVNKSGWYWVAISYIFISFAYSLATAIHSSYIPILADIELDMSRSEDKKGLLEGESEVNAMERSRGRLSDIGLMSGLFLGTIASLISAIISFQFNGSNTSLIYTLFVSSLLWLVLGIIGWYILENKPGPPIKNPIHYITLSWNKLGLTLSSARSYSNILILFMGWFMLLDSVSMLFILLKLIGKVQVGMTAADFLLMACLTSPLEVLGMIFYNFIQKRFNLNCKQMIIIHLVFYLIFPIYYFIGTFLNFGFDSKAEVYILKLVLIFPYSHLSSVQRVLLSNFIPAGRETEFFSLNQVFGRGTAWIGPLLVGSVESFTGNIRYGFIFPIAFMLVGLVFLLQINVERGLDQAKENSLSGAVYEMLEVDS